MSLSKTHPYGPHKVLQADSDIPEDFELDLALCDGTQYELPVSAEEDVEDLFRSMHAKRKPLLEYEAALANFEAVCNDIKESGDYQSSRKLYLFASFELNAHGKQAPAFRTKLTTGKKHNDPVFLQIHSDNIVIDCHWLSCIHAEVFVNEADKEFAPLFDYNNPFNFKLADRFASKKWKTENRTLEVLRLIDFYQIQCVALKSDAMKGKLKCLDQPRKENGKRVASIRSAFEQKLLAWGASVKSIKSHYDTYRALWTIHMLLGSDLNNRMLSTLTAFALGQPRKDPKTVKTQLDTLLKRVHP